MTTLEMLEEVSAALHRYHPMMHPRQIGKGICEFPPCVIARELRGKLRELDPNARQAEIATNRKRLSEETP